MDFFPNQNSFLPQSGIPPSFDSNSVAGQPSTVPVPPPRQPGRHTRLWIVLAIAGMIVVVGTGLGYVAYSQGYLQIPFLKTNSSSLAEKMVESIAGIKNAQYAFRMHVETQPRAAKAQPLFNDNTNLYSNSNSQLSNTELSNVADNCLSDPSQSNCIAVSSFRTSLDMLFRSIPTDLVLDGGMTIYADIEAANGGNGTVALDGSYTGGDATMEAAVEGRKIGDTLYVDVKKFPALFFFDFSAIKNKWIKIEKNDIDAFLPIDFTNTENNKKTAEAARDALRAVFARGLLTLDSKLPAETIAGTKTDHYRLTVHADKLRDVFQDSIDAAKKRGDDTQQLEDVMHSLENTATQQLVNTIASQSTFELWIEPRSGLPRQVKWTVAVVPPDSLERLQGKQLSLSFQLTLENVNKRLNVDAPGDTISFDEATRLLSGISKEEQDFEKQAGQIQELKSVLNAYRDKKQAYPDSLDQLNTSLNDLVTTCTTSANTNSTNNANTPNAFDYSCSILKRYAKNGVKTTDAYTGQPYGYTKNADTYTLSFDIQYYEGMSEYEKTEYTEGTNTYTSTATNANIAYSILPKTPPTGATNTDATADSQTKNTNTIVTTVLSSDSDNDGLNDTQELSYGSDPKKSDTDGDGLPDYDEVMKYQTDPAKADTDGDGFSDLTEVTAGYNPKGPGLATTQQKLSWSSKSSYRNGPTIENPAVSQNNSSAIVSWTLSEPGDGIINYGTTAGYGQSKSDFSFTGDHALTILVTSGTIYHYSIRSCTQAPNSRCSSTLDATFTAK